MTSRKGEASRLFINRELSWLAFNERVLEEAADSGVPLLERVKFAAIAASNLDEFFMVRVAGLREAVADGDETTDLAGLTASRQLAAVSERATAFTRSLYDLLTTDLLPALASQGIRIAGVGEVTAAQRASVTAFFEESVLPVITPLAVDVSRPVPLLSSLSLNLVVLLSPAPGESDPRLAIVQVPSRLTRMVQIAAADGVMFVLLGDIIRAHLPRIFSGQTILETALIRLARDAELELDDEGGRTHLELVEREVRQRRRGDIVRLELEAAASATLANMIRRMLDVPPDAVSEVPGPLDLRVLMTLVDLPGFEPLRNPPFQPVNVLAVEHRDLFSVLDERDVLLHHPYESYEPVLALLAQAADDPDVLAIKLTLYRANSGSSVIASLRRAAERNKQVTVIVELTARFDEERNIQWARALEEAGAHVIYGIRGYKVHAKICLIVKRTAHGLRRYVHLGTGNYNERTARMYTDFGLMTASQVIAEDASAIFSALTGYSDPPRLKKLVLAPTGLRQRILALIAREQRRAEAGQEAEILAKMNSLIDGEIIDALYAASRAGVRICLNVRGICALRPGVAGASETISVVSVVDRFLEHSRIYSFLNGGEEQVFLASADWMTRNLDRRVEVMFPIETPDHKAKVLHALRAMFRDTMKGRWLGADGVYHRRPATADEPSFRVQQALQEESRRAASAASDAAGISFQPERRQRARS